MYRRMIEEMLDKAEKQGVFQRNVIIGNSKLEEKAKSSLTVWDSQERKKKKVPRRGASCFYFDFPIYFFLLEALKTDELLRRYVENPSEKYLVLVYGTPKIGKVIYAKNPREVSVCNCIVAVIRGNVVNERLQSLELVSVYPDKKDEFSHKFD